MPAFLAYHGCHETAAHSGHVASESRQIAALAGVDGSKAELAGWLHDVSAVFPPEERISAAHMFGIDVLPEEDVFPLVIHQKLSVVLARDIFHVEDEAVLCAIGCHTTLRANAAVLDKVLFVADKIEWDQPGRPPYKADLLLALEESLDQAVFYYLCMMWARRRTLRVIHPWLRAAYEQLSGSATLTHTG